MIFNNKECLPDKFIEFIKQKYHNYPFPLYQTNDKIELYIKDIVNYCWFDLPTQPVFEEIEAFFRMDNFRLLCEYKKCKGELVSHFNHYFIEILEYLLDIKNGN
jgi:hypothetical protein